MEGPSGYGFELTFRLKKQPGETVPPPWPAELLQQLARYVFQTGIKCIFSDYYFVNWNVFCKVDDASSPLAILAFEDRVDFDCQ